MFSQNFILRVITNSFFFFPSLSLYSLDQYIESNVCLAPQTSHNTATSIAQKVLKSSDKLKTSKSKDRILYDDDSFSSTNTFSSENSNLSGD